VNLSKENGEERKREERERRREESFEHLVIRGYNFGEYLLLLIFATKKKHLWHIQNHGGRRKRKKNKKTCDEIFSKEEQDSMRNTCGIF
jgi:hypothetical protein